MEEYYDGSAVPVCLTAADTFWPALFFVLTISIFFVIPFAILLILYTVIAKNLMENPIILTHHTKNNNIVGGSVLRYRKQVVLMLGTVVISFFVCLLPFKALTLWIIIVPPETILALGIDGYYILLYFCRIMLYLNSAINPILYNLMSTKFREGFVKLLKIDKMVNCRKHLKDSIKRRDTFNTTTSTTNFSSSQTTSDSFWKKYSHRSSSQKTLNQNGSVKESDKFNPDSLIQQIKLSEIVGLENTRRNSMKRVTELAAIRNDIGDLDYGLNVTRENLELHHIPEDTPSLSEKHSVNNSDNKSNISLERQACDRVFNMNEYSAKDNRAHYVRIPLISARNKQVYDCHARESFV